MTARGPQSGSQPRAKVNSSSLPRSACNISSGKAQGQKGMDEGRWWAFRQETLVTHYDGRESYYKTHAYLFFISCGDTQVCPSRSSIHLAAMKGHSSTSRQCVPTGGEKKKPERAHTVGNVQMHMRAKPLLLCVMSSCMKF